MPTALQRVQLGVRVHQTDDCDLMRGPRSNYWVLIHRPYEEINCLLFPYIWTIGRTVCNIGNDEHKCTYEIHRIGRMAQAIVRS